MDEPDLARIQPLSALLAAHVAEARFTQLPPASVHAARRALLDAVGVMRAASGLAPEARPFVDFALAQGGAPEATVFGARARVPAPLAAFAHGAMAHALDYEDSLDGAPLHPDASLVPALLALAQAHAPVPATELLTALAVGCDVACRVALCLRARLEDGGWYPPPILGALGAVAGAARLLRLPAHQVVDAWSLLMLTNSAPAEIKHDAHTELRAVREAFPAQAAVQAVLLARRGVRGFARPLEGRGGFFRLFAAGRIDETALLDGLGHRWWIEQLSFKPWPCCRGTHAAVELALQLRQAHDLRPADIAAVEIEGNAVQAMLAQPLARKQAPRTAIDARFSLPFTVATALARGEVTLADFAPSALQAPATLALAARVSFRQRADWPIERATGAGLLIRTCEGRELRAELTEALGSPARPLSDEALVAKYVDCATRGAEPCEPAVAALTARRILALATEADVGEAVLAGS